MVGPVTDTHYVGPASAQNMFRVSVRNTIESDITIREAFVHLLANPETNEWVLASVRQDMLPLSLEGGAEKEIYVESVENINKVWSASLKPLKVDVDLDFNAIWLSIFETPGWDDITHSVTVEIAQQQLTGNNLDKVLVVFNHDEAIAELTPESLSYTAKLTKPLLPYLLNEEVANDYFYRIESYRKVDGEDVFTLVASSGFHKTDDSHLTIIPPLA